MLGRCLIVFVAIFFVASPGFAQLPADTELLLDYSQWKLAAGNGQSAEPVAIAAQPGFAVEVLRTAEKGEGSWISLAFDVGGRLLVGREDKGILQFTLAADAKTVANVEPINDTLLEPRGLLLAHDSLYVTANNSKGLYRLRKSGDGYEAPELLQRLEGGVGHGRNGMALGPDGRIYIACGNNVKVPASLDLKRSPYRNFALDRLLPCAWNEFLFDSDVQPPCGFVLSCNAEGRDLQLVAGGFRNPYDLAFNGDGELFTYDADMEWDVGAPWYRPTTVIHVVPGGEYGWRQGTNVWPDHFPDALPRVVDVGLGSPTGIAFGHHSKFPAPYRDALFILDWAYGRILAVHLTTQGASYRGKVETFLRGKPLNVTDVAFGPDGAMYFTVGGRGTRSALYRVSWTGKASDGQPVETNEPARQARERRRSLEPLLTQQPDDAVAKLWPELTSTDPVLRHVAHLALENQPLDRWENRTALPMAIMARVRADKEIDSNRIAARLALNLRPGADQATTLTSLRTAQLLLIREKTPTPETRSALRESLEPLLPAQSFSENQLLVETLVALQSEGVVERTLLLLPKAESDQQRLFYLYALRLANEDWTLDRRREYLKWLKASEKFAGAHYLPRFLTYIRTDALATFSDEERAALVQEIDALGRFDDAGAPPPRPEIKKWSLPEVTASVLAIKRPINVEQGEKLYAEAQCIRCHRHQEQGIPFGPDLQHVAGRFGMRELLEAIVEPSKVIDDKYRTLLLETSEGQTATGFLVGGTLETLFVAADPLRPTTFQRVPRAEISSRKQSPLSPMPEGLLNGLTAEEIYDLLGFLGAVQPK